MRLIPFNVVFLLLLACSLQIREEVALRLTAASGATSVSVGMHASRVTSSADSLHSLGDPALDRAGRITELGPRALATVRTNWTMRTPALESTLVASVTGLRRA